MRSQNTWSSLVQGSLIQIPRVVEAKHLNSFVHSKGDNCTGRAEAFWRDGKQVLET